MLTLRDILFSAIGAFGAFLIYLAKRWIEKSAEKERVELDQRRYELIETYLGIRNQWEPQGSFVEPPSSIAALITQSPTPTQWHDNLVAVAGLHLRAVHTACMYIEAISVKYPEYLETLELFRNEYVKWYVHARDKLPVIFDRMVPLECKIWHSYYHRITEPTQINIEGFFASLQEFQNAIDSGKLKLASS